MIKQRKPKYKQQFKCLNCGSAITWIKATMLEGPRCLLCDLAGYNPNIIPHEHRYAKEEYEEAHGRSYNDYVVTQERLTKEGL